MSIMEHNGGSVIAMTGRNCIAIATDLRLGASALTLSFNNPKIFPVGAVPSEVVKSETGGSALNAGVAEGSTPEEVSRLWLGLPGLASDTRTVWDNVRKKVAMYKLNNEKDIEPRTFAHMLSSMQYERRWGPWFIECIVAGLDKEDEPFIAATDVIGCINYARDFVLSGTASEKLFGMAEALWEPDLGPEELFETISQAMLNAVDRDAFSGWGAKVVIVEKDKVTTRYLKARMD